MTPSKIFAPGFAIAIFFLLSSCGQATRGFAQAEGTTSVVAFEASAKAMDMPLEDRIQPSEPQTVTPGPRKRIKTGSLSLEVQDLNLAEGSLKARLEAVGGWISSSNRYTGSMNITVRLPAEAFEAFLEQLSGTGRLLSRSVQEQDVTLQFFDLDARIQNKKILQKRYQDYLAQAKSMEDILKVESSLNEVTYELEAMQGSFKHLSDQIEFSTLSVSLELPVSRQDSDSKLPSLGEGFYSIWVNFLAFLVYFAVGFFALLLFGVPVVLALGLLWWLGFGKIGLIRKFFSALNRS